MSTHQLDDNGCPGGRHCCVRVPLRRGDADRGQVVPLMALALVLVAGVAWVIVAVGEVLADRATARTAADAAALAAAAEPVESDSDAAAARLASANGAQVVAIHRHGRQVEVEVRVGRATARARAEAVWSPASAAGRGDPSKSP